MTFQDRLEQARKAKQMSQEALGVGLGKDGANMSKQAVSHWEKGRNEPSVSQLGLICARLGCSADWLILGREVAPAMSPTTLELATLIEAQPEPVRLAMLKTCRDSLEMLATLARGENPHAPPAPINRKLLSG